MLGRHLPTCALLAAMLAATSGCGWTSNPTPIQANRLASAQGMPSRYSQQRLVVSFKSGGQTKSLLTGKMGLKLVRDLPQLNLSVLALPASANRAAILSTLASQPDVASVEADAIVSAQYQPQDPSCTFGNDAQAYPEFRAEMRQAWDLTLGDPNLVVAVVDTGVDVTHPELRDRMVTGQNFVTQVEEPTEDGGTQLVDVPDRGPMDDAGHGTHCAGIIAASENQQGVTGVAPRCKIMPIKSLAYNENGFSSDVANGVVWAVDHGAKVINMSLGAYGGSKALEKAVAYALSKHVVVIAAMGNDRDKEELDFGRSPSYPAALPGVIAVGASNESDRIANFSNAGRWISVSAPGGDNAEYIYSTTPTYKLNKVQSDYDYMRGTSMAAPFVSGLVALMLSLNHRLTPAQVKSRLETTADDLGVPGFDTLSGHGRINPYRALTF